VEPIVCRLDRCRNFRPSQPTSLRTFMRGHIDSVPDRDGGIVFLIAHVGQCQPCFAGVPSTV